MPWSDTGPDCKRCFKPTRRCGTCKGEGRVPYMFGDCTACDGTGWVCSQDGKYWNK
jgi:RecJ-like exonuclease